MLSAKTVTRQDQATPARAWLSFVRVILGFGRRFGEGKSPQSPRFDGLVPIPWKKALWTDREL